MTRVMTSSMEVCLLPTTVTSRRKIDDDDDDLSATIVMKPILPEGPFFCSSTKTLRYPYSHISFKSIQILECSILHAIWFAAILAANVFVCLTKKTGPRPLTKHDLNSHLSSLRVIGNLEVDRLLSVLSWESKGTPPPCHPPPKKIGP